MKKKVLGLVFAAILLIGSLSTGAAHVHNMKPGRDYIGSTSGSHYVAVLNHEEGSIHLEKCYYTVRTYQLYEECTICGIRMMGPETTSTTHSLSH